MNLEFRTHEYLPNNQKWLWPKEDIRCWRYYTEIEKRTYAKKNIKAYHLPDEICSLILNKNLVIQAGGNSGLYPYIFAKYFDRVITFEPDHRWFSCLSYNTKNINNIFKFQSALGKDFESVSLETPIVDNEINLGGIYTKKNGDIPKIKIDSLGLSPDLIQLDIEGGEIDALLGALETINRYKPMIVIEYDHRFLERYNWKIETLDQLFKNIDYICIKDCFRDKIYIHKDQKKLYDTKIIDK